MSAYLSKEVLLQLANTMKFHPTYRMLRKCFKGDELGGSFDGYTYCYIDIQSESALDKILAMRDLPTCEIQVHNEQ